MSAERGTVYQAAFVFATAVQKPPGEATVA